VMVLFVACSFNYTFCTKSTYWKVVEHIGGDMRCRCLSQLVSARDVSYLVSWRCGCVRKREKHLTQTQFSNLTFTSPPPHQMWLLGTYSQRQSLGFGSHSSCPLRDTAPKSHVGSDRTA